jgi:hypothetical protein
LTKHTVLDDKWIAARSAWVFEQFPRITRGLFVEHQHDVILIGGLLFEFVGQEHFEQRSRNAAVVLGCTDGFFDESIDQRALRGQQTHCCEHDA